MSPLQPFITSLGIAIEVHLQNCHIIDRSQVLVEIISNGPDSEELRSVYSNRFVGVQLQKITILKCTTNSKVES